MTNEPDDELNAWITDWQGEAEPASDVREQIRRRVQARSRRMALAAVFEILFGLGMLIFVLSQALLDPAPLNVGAMACFALLILWAIAFSLWNLRGTWRPSAETSRAFVDLSLLRCRRRRQALTAGLWLLALEVAVFLPWILLSVRAKALAFGLLAVLTLILSTFLWISVRRIQRELKEWEILRESLTLGERGPTP